ncbi:MAG: NUDIX domain-containing protein [Caryophanon sp.]|nr:NUDIX domain-containing protein [Caryophanon sp.]
MFTFEDLHGCKVELSFTPDTFAVASKHVLILVQHEGKWLTTIHRNRGTEFPGGKVEEGETLAEAAIREVYEETGVHITDVAWFAEYAVHAEPLFSKTVFTARFLSQESLPEEYETIGTAWLAEDDIFRAEPLSFYMQDDGMKMLLQEVKQHDRKW